MTIQSGNIRTDRNLFFFSFKHKTHIEICSEKMNNAGLTVFGAHGVKRNTFMSTGRDHYPSREIFDGVRKGSTDAKTLTRGSFLSLFCSVCVFSGNVIFGRKTVALNHSFPYNTRWFLWNHLVKTDTLLFYTQSGLWKNNLLQGYLGLFSLCLTSKALHTSSKCYKKSTEKLKNSTILSR